MTAPLPLWPASQEPCAAPPLLLPLHSEGDSCAAQCAPAFLCAWPAACPWAAQRGECPLQMQRRQQHSHEQSPPAAGPWSPRTLRSEDQCWTAPSRPKTRADSCKIRRIRRRPSRSDSLLSSRSTESRTRSEWRQIRPFCLRSSKPGEPRQCTRTMLPNECREYPQNDESDQGTRSFFFFFFF